MKPTNGLTQNKDGLQGISLGVVSGFQYALSDSGQVFRRSASSEGTYGGWRWECEEAHMRQYAAIYPGVADRLPSAPRVR
jgi:hypothetical protein